MASPARTLLYLVRHAPAEARGEDWPDDTVRPLSSAGRARFRRAARGLSRLRVRLDLILTSPLVRAHQTADLLAAAFAPLPPLVVTEALAPGAPVAAVMRTLRGHSRASRVALVGHEPGLGVLAAHLLGLAEPLPFRKGAIACIELDGLRARRGERHGRLRWFLTPRALRLMAHGRRR